MKDWTRDQVRAFSLACFTMGSTLIVLALVPFGEAHPVLAILAAWGVGCVVFTVVRLVQRRFPVEAMEDAPT